jgi:hypothetical protein
MVNGSATLTDQRNRWLNVPDPIGGSQIVKTRGRSQLRRSVMFIAQRITHIPGMLFGAKFRRKKVKRLKS